VSTRLESTIVQAGGKLVVTVTVDNKSGFPLPQIDVKVIETMNAAIKDSTMNKMGAMQEPPGLKCVGQAAFGPVGASERRSEAVVLRLSGAGDVWGTTLLTEGHDWDRFAFAVDYRVEVDVWKFAATGCICMGSSGGGPLQALWATGESPLTILPAAVPGGLSQPTAVTVTATAAAPLPPRAGAGTASGGDDGVEGEGSISPATVTLEYAPPATGAGVCVPVPVAVVDETAMGGAAVPVPVAQVEGELSAAS